MVLGFLFLIYNRTRTIEYPWAKDSRIVDIFRTQKAAEDCARELSPDCLLRIYSELPEEAEYYKKTLKWKCEEYKGDGIFFVHVSAEGEEFDIYLGWSKKNIKIKKREGS